LQGNAVSGQVTVVDGRLFVTSSTGRIYSLDAKTGCTYWTYDAPAGSHTAVSIGESAPPRSLLPPPPAGRRKHGKAKKTLRQMTLAHLEILKAPSAAFFGDDNGAVYALDAQKGTLLWKTQVDAHPLARITGSPVVYRGRLYVVVASKEQLSAANAGYVCCTFRGSVAALDLTSGRILWRTMAIDEEPRPAPAGSSERPEIGPSGASISAAPTIDSKRNVAYVATGGSLTGLNQPLSDAVVALDLTDGRVRWSKKFPRHEQVGAADFTSSPIVRTLGDRQVIIAAQKSGIVYALDPDRGDVIWQSKVSEDATPAAIEWGPAADHRRLYVGLSGLTAEPDNTSGALAALDLKNGLRRWYTPAPSPACSWGGQNCAHAEAQAVTVMPGIAFSGSMDGHLRAYSTIDGKVVWDFDTAKEYVAVNGIRASGGSLDQGGATIVNGVLYINSGNGQRSGQPGNVLLAFSVDGK
ncbi:MAG: PQQ-binding-like beta-propeller repeat protein, partial [Pseudomonadota bacterium]|nr:PQQ-binding-like beta-propeller repeat protein [Pseudomonadota bacterium]